MSAPIKIDGMIAKIEGTYAADPTPVVGTDNVQISERIFPQLTIEHLYPNNRENAVTGTILPAVPANPQGRIVRLDFGVEMKGPGVAYAAGSFPPELPLLLACGMAQTTDYPTGIDLAPASSGHSSCTIWAYGDDNVFKINGFRGTWTMPINAGQQGMIRFQGIGLLRTAVAAAAAPTTGYSTVESPADVDMSLTIGSWSPDVVSAEFRAGNRVVVRPSANGTDGIAQVRIVEMRPEFQITAPTPAIATYNAYTDQAEQTQRSIDFTRGSAQYNTIDIESALGYLEPGAIKHTEHEGETAFDLTYVLTGYNLAYT